MFTKTNLMILTVLSMFSASSYARIGETEAESKIRYGNLVNEAGVNMMPILSGAVHHIYVYQGWNIKVAFVNGKAVRMRYFKHSATMEIKNDEALAILEGEANGGQWQEKRNFSFGNILFSKVWVNTNGSVAYIEGLGGMFLVVDTPAAQAFIQAKKAADEQQRKAAIPKF